MFARKDITRKERLRELVAQMDFGPVRHQRVNVSTKSVDRVIFEIDQLA